MADMRFRVRAHSENPTKTVVQARGFEMVIDEPAELGGTNKGANPVEYELAALCGCINVMSHIVAAEMKFELRGVKINVAGTLNPDRLFGKSLAERAGYKEIKLEVKPDCDASPEVLEKWLKQVEERCPVSDNLMNQTPVKLEVKL